MGTIPESTAPDTTMPDNIPREVKSPLHFFRLLFRDKIFNLIVENTNAYGQDKKGEEWRAVTVQEIYLFIALIL